MRCLPTGITVVCCRSATATSQHCNRNSNRNRNRLTRSGGRSSASPAPRPRAARGTATSCSVTLPGRRRTGEWGVCLLVALSEVTRFRASGAERGDSGGGIAENIPESFELRHPVVGYRVKEHMLQKVAGFQDVKTAREWIRG